VLVFLTGAPSHIDTFDLKPDAPEEIRGTFRPIDTAAPGLTFCEHLPKLARLAGKLAVIRSMTHGLPSHEHATHMMLTGIDVMPPGATHMASRADWPCYASGVDYLRPCADGVPSGVLLPTYLNNGYGFSGQTAGLLGPKYDPWQIRRDPNDRGFAVDELTLPVGLRAEAVMHRRKLLAEVERQSRAIEDEGARTSFDGIQGKAFTMLGAGAVKRALDLEREDPRLRDRYGRHMIGQSLLLARRLVEAGVRFVNVNDKITNGQLANWDSHENNFPRLKDDLLPPADQAFSALIEDLESRGLLESTLVVALAEFGRTPRINGNRGRDHWPDCFSVVLAGGGVRGGVIHGASDRFGAFPALDPVSPGDLAATLFWRFGIDPHTEIRDLIARPYRVAEGQPLARLFA
jgi:hypothetical protein